MAAIPKPEVAKPLLDDRPRLARYEPGSWGPAKARKLAAHLLEAAPEDIELADYKYSVKGSPDKGMTLAEAAGAAYVPENLPDGMEPGLEVLQRVREEVDVPVLTDIHDVSQVEDVAKVVDVLQIPAFLSRQTDLILAAARSGSARGRRDRASGPCSSGR